MQIDQEMEYCNITLWFKKEQIMRLMRNLVDAGFDVAWKESKRTFVLSVKTDDATHRLTFHNKSNGLYRLSNKNYIIRDIKFASIFQQLLEEAKGHAVVKLYNKGQIVIQNIRYGEPVKIVEINGPERKILFEKECTVSMEQVMEAFKRKDAEIRIKVLRLEIDYELATLYEALENNDLKTITESKQRLEELRKELLLLEV